MSDFKNFNGYNVKDEVARNGLVNLQTQIDNIDEVVKDLNVVDIIDSQYITGPLYFVSGKGYSPNTIEIDLSQIENVDEYNYINFIGLGATDMYKEHIVKVEIPKGDGRKNLSPQYPCYANTTSQISSRDGDIQTVYMEVNTYYGSVAFEIKRVLNGTDNKLQIRAFNTPMSEKATTTTKTRISTGEVISTNTTYEYKFDKNGSMIVSGGYAGFYTEFSGFGLSVF